MRRTISLLALLLAAAATACTNPTAPEQAACGPVGGSHTCQQ